MALELPWVRLAPEYARLYSFLQATRAANVLGAVVVVGTGDAREVYAANVASLNQVEFTLKKLDVGGELGRAVYERPTQEAVNRWCAVANTLGNTLAAVWGTFDPQRTSFRVWSEVVVPTVQGVATGVQGAATAAASAAGGAGFGVGAVVAAIVAYKVLR